MENVLKFVGVISLVVVGIFAFSTIAFIGCVGCSVVAVNNVPHYEPPPAPEPIPVEVESLWCVTIEYTGSVRPNGLTNTNPAANQHVGECFTERRECGQTARDGQRRFNNTHQPGGFGVTMQARISCVEADEAYGFVYDDCRYGYAGTCREHNAFFSTLDSARSLHARVSLRLREHCSTRYQGCDSIERVSQNLTPIARLYTLGN